MPADPILVLPAVDEGDEHWPPRIVWPTWAKLARQAGRLRVKALRQRREMGAAALPLEMATMFGPAPERPVWVLAHDLADTMRDIARRTRNAS